MEDQSKSISIDDLPFHIVLEILTSGRLSAVDLICLELTSRTFHENHGLVPQNFRSLIDVAAFRLCESNPIYASLGNNARLELFHRCSQNSKRMLRFLQSVEQSSGMVQTSAGNMQIKSGKYHTLLINDSCVYSCGSSLCGVLGHGSERKLCATFTPISFPCGPQIIQVSASHNHAAFITDSGQVFTCGDNYFSCCGHGDTSHAIFRPKLVEALDNIPCKQVSAGLSFTMFLTRKGHVYTCGTNSVGQLGHGDTNDRPTPEMVEFLASTASVVQVSAGPSYSLAVADDGTLFSFGSGNNFCLGHGEQQNEPQPRAVQSLVRRSVNVVRASAGDEHAVALDGLGHVYTWGKGYCGALGHGDENDRTIPEYLPCLRNHLAVQVCAGRRKTFVLMDDGFVHGFGWMAYGSLGFPDRPAWDKILRPRVLDSLRPHHRVSQVTTGLYHTVVVTDRGKVLGFGDNERSQLGHDTLRRALKPFEICVEEQRNTATAVDMLEEN